MVSRQKNSQKYVLWCMHNNISVNSTKEYLHQKDCLCYALMASSSAATPTPTMENVNSANQFELVIATKRDALLELKGNVLQKGDVKWREASTKRESARVCMETLT